MSDRLGRHVVLEDELAHSLAFQGDRANLGRAQQLGAQRLGDAALGRGFRGKRGELGRFEPAGEPGAPEIGHRGHEDQHLGQHDE